MSENLKEFKGTERVKIPSGDALLKGKVYFPKNSDQNKGYVIFTHGLGYCTRAYELDGEDFASNNYTFLEYNMRGHGTSTGEFTIEKAAEDIPNIINFLEENYNNKGNKVGLIAHSTGGLISLLAATKDPRVDYASCVNVVNSMQDSFKHWFDSDYIKEVRNVYTKNGYIKPGIEKFLSSKEGIEKFKQGDPSFEELSDPDKYGFLKFDNIHHFFSQVSYSPNIEDHIKDLSIPIIFFRGKEDEVIPVEKTEGLYQKLNNDKKELVVTDATDHFFNENWPEVQKKTIEFFNKTNGYK